jgi:hypothetical protein
MFLSMSRHIDPAEAEAILEAITNGQPEVLPPPEPPTLMTMTVYEGRAVIETYLHVADTTLVSPTILRAVLTDRTVILMDMTGRDFVMVPE